MKDFPKDFLWGTATSAHQTEGNNKNCDWWEWEQRKDYKRSNYKYPLEPSLIACDSYNRYEEDFGLCASMGNNAIRFSIEWARIEPKEGVFDQKEVEHYKKVLISAKKRGLKTFITLHHFTTPVWVAKKKGWASPTVIKYFARYAKKCAEEFGDLVDVFLTINEPQVYIYKSYTDGTWTPAKKNLILGAIVQINMIMAHRKAYNAIKAVNKDYKVGIVKNIVWHETLNNMFLLKYIDILAVKIMYWFTAYFMLDLLKDKLDLIGVNYYFTNRISNLKKSNANDVVSDLGWWIYPKGLENVLLSLKRYDLPIYVTENGIADKNDKLRKKFIHDMLTSCYFAIQKGVNLKGYFYWSLIDNYEWHEGYWPKFGIIEIDRKDNLKRIPRSSAKYYARICKSNGLGW